MKGPKTVRLQLRLVESGTQDITWSYIRCFYDRLLYTRVCGIDPYDHTKT